MQLREQFKEFGEDIIDNPGGYPFYEKRRFEQRFLDAYLAGALPETTRTLIPVFWTHIYNDRKYLAAPLQAALDSLSRSGRYYTVMNHDDTPRNHRFDGLDVVHYSGGGNFIGDNVVPIPLITDPIPGHMIVDQARDTLVSYMGRASHPIRTAVTDVMSGKPRAEIIKLGWLETRGGDLFRGMCRSKFALCPRGYGPTSYRLYEAMQCGAVPVYVSDRHWLPFVSREEWSKFCVVAGPSDLPGLYDKLASMPEDEYLQMQASMICAYQKMFTVPGCIATMMASLTPT